MRILAIGDVSGRSGRDCVEKYLPKIKEELKPDFIVLDGDNAAHGFGISAKICAEFYELGVDCITGGNHVWDQREILSYIDKDPKLLRPVNYPQGTQGNGFMVYNTADGRKVLVIHALGRVFMDEMDDPFVAVNAIVSKHAMPSSVNAIIVDFHAETGSEKMAMGHYLDGKVSVVFGTHTHIPTADAMVLPNGTAYQTDLGMSGVYDSVIGVKKHIPIHRFVKKTPTDRMSPANGEATFCASLIETDDATGLAKSIEPIILGPWLRNSYPSLAS